MRGLVTFVKSGPFLRSALQQPQIEIDAAGVGFVPVVVEVLGGWSPEASSTIRRIGDALGRRTNPSCPSQTMKHLFGRLAIALWRGNATLWLRRAPALHPSADGVILFHLFIILHPFASLVLSLFSIAFTCCKKIKNKNRHQ